MWTVEPGLVVEAVGGATLTVDSLAAVESVISIDYEKGVLAKTPKVLVAQ